MSLRKLPLLTNFNLPNDFEPGIMPDSLAKWAPDLELKNAAPGDETVIEIYDVIGAESFFGGGISSRQVANQLRGAGSVTVNINSPGGSFVEGVAIYNMLMAHPGRVTVNVLGWAASAASIIAEAGDMVRMAPTSFFLIHNVQAGVEGDRHDLIETAKMLEDADQALAALYVARTGLSASKIHGFLDAETTFSSAEAIKNGFADELIAAGDVITNAGLKNQAQTVRADRMVDAAVQKMFPGLSRSDRLEVKNAFREGKPGATISPKRDAGLSDIASEIRAMTAQLAT